MSAKIATVSAVFAACEELDKSEKTWNRDDVRSRVGGGGYNLIDPLIKAWRRLKPIKEVAPNTPTELLQLVAEAIESNYENFVSEVVSRESERNVIFDSLWREVSTSLSATNDQLEASESRNEKLTCRNEEQTQEIEKLKLAVDQQKKDCDKLLSENDSLNGAVLRLDSKFKSTCEEYEKELSAKAQLHVQQTQNLKQSHKEELEELKIELNKQNVLAEDRLMRLIDQSRTDAKKQQIDASKLLDTVRLKVEDARERISTLQSDNSRLQSELSTQKLENSRFSVSLDKANNSFNQLEEEYAAFRADSDNSKFDELNATLLAINEKIKPEVP